MNWYLSQSSHGQIKDAIIRMDSTRLARSNSLEPPPINKGNGPCSIIELDKIRSAYVMFSGSFNIIVYLQIFYLYMNT